MIEQPKNDKEEKLGLFCKIIVSDSTQLFNKTKIIKEYSILLNENYPFLVLKRNLKSFAIMKDHSLIKPDEYLIFKLKIKSDPIELYNPIDRCSSCINQIKLYNKIAKLNYKLWQSLKSIPKSEKDFKITEENKNLYLYELKQNDIIRMGDIKFILREINIIHDNNLNNINNNINNNDQNNKCHDEFMQNQYIMKIKPSEGNVCEICKKTDMQEDNPIIKLCECENYYHFKCMKAKIKERVIKEEDKSGGCTRYYIKTNCLGCKKFINLRFILDEKDNNNNYNYLGLSEKNFAKKPKLYELIDIKKEKKEEYLIFETIDFKDTQYEYIKYFFYIKFRKLEKNKNVETILIGGDRTKNEKYRYDKLIKIEKNNTISSQHALIDYDIEEKTLILRNISDSHNTLILKDKNYLEIIPNNDEFKFKQILLELGNIKIEPYLIKSNEFEEYENKMKNNPEPIEIRE